jgi:5-formyltetrahydrofolate cyclo-ligase
MIVHLRAYREAKVIAVFIPLPSEIQIRDIITHAFDAGKIVVAPRCLPGNLLSFHRMQPDYLQNLESGIYGLQEPPREWEIFDTDATTGPAVMLVPGLAFTPDGCRLGKGKGYYDRTLATLGAHWTTIGICYSWQVVERLPADSLDKPVDMVVDGRQVHDRRVHGGQHPED